MDNKAYEKLIVQLNMAAEPLLDKPDKYSGLLEKIGHSRFVLIGEATHGTHEFYQERAMITQQLIEKKDFMAIAIEGDFPDVHRIHSYLQGTGDKEDSQHALDAFKRFPIWMWRNVTMPPFLRWLRSYNDQFPNVIEKVGFYGLDLYSLHSSLQAVIDYLKKVDPSAAKRAIARYSCFDHLQVDPETYGHLTTLGIKKSCTQETIEQLVDLQHNNFKYLRQNGIPAEDEYFYAAQNARLIKNAEAYYRSMFQGRVSSWNVRDRHMAETLNIIVEHLEKRSNKPAKIVVWAHNSHVGDARATEMCEQGEVNIGQLVREQYGIDAYSIGFSTYQGFVTAASHWGGPDEPKPVTPGFESSYEELFHHMKYENFLLNLRDNDQLEHFLKIPRLQRAIGVIYRPETERLSHYYFTRLPYQFDSIIHLDQTTAVSPLLS